MQIEKLECWQHPLYKIGSGRPYDVGLILLLIPLRFNANVAAVNLPYQSDAKLSLEGRRASVVGFGRTSDSSSVSDTLQYGYSRIVVNEVCENYFDSFWKVITFQDNPIGLTNLCLSTKNTYSASACPGDSGGGVTVNIDGRTTLVGVISWGGNKCSRGYPVVLVDIQGHAIAKFITTIAHLEYPVKPYVIQWLIVANKASFINYSSFLIP